MNQYPRFRDRFAEAMDPRLYNIEFLDWLIVEGRAFCLATDHAAIIAEVKTYPTGAKVLTGLVAAGELADIVDQLIPQAEELGRQEGCVLAVIESRSGWVKALKSSGYETHQTALRKEL